MTLLDANGLDEQEFLARYNPKDYDRPSVTVDMVIFAVADVPCVDYRRLSRKELRVLLIKRGGHPCIGQWALPGGFVESTETVGEAAIREVIEETGVECRSIEQLRVFSKPKRDPRTRIIGCAHMALVNISRADVKAGDDARDAKWFTVRVIEDQAAITSADTDEDTPSSSSHAKEDSTSAAFNPDSDTAITRLTLSHDDIRLSATIACSHNLFEPEILENDGLAFDHAAMISDAIHRLRSSLAHTDAAFRLMPETFTLTELQQTYEAILDKPLHKAAFRRKVSELVTATGNYTQHAGHRPSQLYIRRR